MRIDTNIYLDPSDATGISLIPGPGRTVAERVSELPAHRLEVHIWQASSQAMAFIDGIKLVGGNRISCRRHSDLDLNTNRLVIVAHFSEDRPDVATVAEAVPFITHVYPAEDARIIGRDLTLVVAKRAAELEQRRQRVRPLLELMASHGIVGSYDGNVGPSCAFNTHKDPHAGIGCFVSPTDDGLWEATSILQDNNGYLAEKARDPRIVDILSEVGWTFDDHEISHPPIRLEETPAMLRILADAWDRVREVLLVIWRERTAVKDAQAKADARERSRLKRGRKLATADQS